ncbi:MAG: PAS domain-containing protein, partial [Arcobacter sp.]|nr:PAS domain-containing protein [Arcobacter sp.]
DRNQEARFIIREAIDQGKSCEVELRNYKKDGTLFYNLLSLSPIFDTNGKLLYYVGIQNDITRLKQQSELYFQKKRGESLTQLIKNISHQWRQPLSLISILSGAIQLKIEAGILSNDELIENTTKIVETTQYLSNILSDFDSFLVNDNKSNFKLKDLFIESIIMIPKINFVIGFDDNFEISSYKHILGQCIISLIGNCENALEDKSEKYIFIDAIKTQTHTTITIKDNGGGISEDILENVFDPYFTTKHQSQGTGLGLYLIQVFLQNINGNIFIKNINFKYNEQNYKGVVATIILENK